MTYIIDGDTLEFLWSALNEQPQRPRLAKANLEAMEFVKSGWVFRCDLEDFLIMLDSRLSSYEFNVKEFSKTMGIHWEPVCFRPKVTSSSVMEFDGIRVEDAALLLMLLERIGFQVDPTILVSRLLPPIKSRKKKIFSAAELDIFWFEKCRHKNEAIQFALDNATWGNETKVLKTPAGYTAELESDHIGKPIRLKVIAPKYRKRAEPISTKCQDCGLEWNKGDQDSSARHRKEHKRRMAYLDPQPCKELIEELKIDKDAAIVLSNAPSWKNKEMYERALAFKRELRFDFLQWSEEGSDDPDVQGILLTNSMYAIVGAICFRTRTTQDEEIYWELDWVWICPKERGSGHLSQRWDWFKDRFGDFVVSSPVSEQMKIFLKRKGDSELIKPLKNRNKAEKST